MDEKGEGNLGQERRISFAVATLQQQQQSSSALPLICRSAGEWMLLQVSITEAQELGWAGPQGHHAGGGTRCPLFVTFSAGDAMGTWSFIPPFSLHQTRL